MALPDFSNEGVLPPLREEHDFGAEPRPFEYNVLSRRKVARQHGFDVLVAREKSSVYQEYVAYFQQVKGRPGLEKGLLRLKL